MSKTEKLDFQLYLREFYFMEYSEYQDLPKQEKAAIRKEYDNYLSE